VDKTESKVALYIFPFAIVLFIAARLWNLTDSCFWFDEIFSVHAATNDWSNFISFIAQDLVHPPLFYLLLKLWITIGGESLLWTRLFAVMVSILTLIPFLLLCRELKLTRNQILYALIAFAVNGSLIKYAQDVRMYSLLVFLSLASIWFFVHWQDNANTRFIGLLLINLLLIYTHYFGWLIVITELCILIWQREKIKQFLLQIFILALAFAPWFILVFNSWQENQGLSQNIGWQNRPNLWQLFSSLHQPFYFPISNLETTAIIISLPILLISVGLIIYEFTKNSSEKTTKLLTAFVIIPLILAFVASWIFPISIWGIRHLTVIFMPYFLIFAISLSNFKLKYAAIPILFVLTSISGFVEFTRPKQTFIWCAWENAAKQIEPNAKIYTFEDLVAYHLWFANKNFEITKINGYEDLPEDKAYFLPRGFNAIKIGDKTSLVGNSFYLAFRDEKQIPFKQVLQDLRLKGYKIDEPIKVEAQGLIAFMFRVSMQPSP
jgi:Dolichyl-phosphate-mannose-protein mannosyltransferase